MRLVLAAVECLAFPVFAKDPGLNCAEQPRPRWGLRSSHESATRLVRAVKTNLAGWALVGEGYQLRCDEGTSDCGVMILRSQPWAQPRAGALVHEEQVQQWQGKRFDFSAELRAGGVTGRAQVVLVAQDREGNVMAVTKSAALQGTTSFERQSVSLDVPAEAARLLVGVELVGAGAIFVKDLPH